MRFFTLIFLLSCTPIIVLGQEHEESEPHDFKRHRVAYGLGNSHVPKGQNPAGGSFKLFIPTWSLEYAYSFNHRWGIGIRSDLEFMTYIVETNDGNLLEREFPFLLSVVGAVRLKDELFLFAGPGVEFEKHKNLFIAQIGLAYEFKMHKEWDLTPSFSYTAKEDIYNTWTFLLTVGKHF